MIQRIWQILTFPLVALGVVAFALLFAIVSVFAPSWLEGHDD